MVIRDTRNRCIVKVGLEPRALIAVTVTAEAVPIKLCVINSRDYLQVLTWGYVNNMDFGTNYGLKGYSVGLT